MDISLFYLTDWFGVASQAGIIISRIFAHFSFFSNHLFTFLLLQTIDTYMGTFTTIKCTQTLDFLFIFSLVAL